MGSKKGTYRAVIREWHLNKTLLAAKMEVNAYTFKMKLLGTDPRYRFTEAEEQKLYKVLNELAKDIDVLIHR